VTVRPLLLIGVVACNNTTDESTPLDQADDSATSIDDSSTSSDDSGDSGTDDSGDSGIDVEITKVTARLHADFASLIYVSWEQNVEAGAWVEYSFDKGVWVSSPKAEATAGPVERLVLGVPYETDAQFRVCVDTAKGAQCTEESSIRTGDLPKGLPIPEVLIAEPKLWEPTGNYLYTSINEDVGGWKSGTYWMLIFDRRGRVVWSMKNPDGYWTIYVRVSDDGHDLMWDDNTVWTFSGDADSEVHRMKIDGTEVETYTTPGLHHAWVDLPDGTIAWGDHVSNNEEWLEEMAPDGTVSTVWKCSDFEIEMFGDTGHGCHSNSWWWDATDDSYLVSFPSSAGDVKDTVLHLDHDGNTLTTWGALSDWTFDPVESTFRYQHGVTFTDAGTLLLSTKLTEANPYYDPNLDTLAAREYELDYKTKTLHQIWSFGEDQGIAGVTAGEAHRLPNGNTLHNYGSGARTREITPGGELVWDVKWPDGDSEGRGRLQGRSIFIENLYDFAP
jgi:hypothetical protein